jgi:hypothetical protein
MENLSYKTAIKRNTLSAPLKWLLCKGMISDTHLDYGCGRGDDAKTMGYDKYDPWYFPKLPTKKYSSITCTYVLNVIKTKKERNEVIKKLKHYLKPGGVAYIAVRRDIKREGKTSIGTHQYNVELNLPVLRETKGFAIYEVRKKKR